jgi:signal transduction histidine kinase
MVRLPNSLRVHVILPILVITLATSVSVAIYEAKLVEETELSIAQENALLLANSIDAGISTFADLSPERSQASIDSLTAANPETSEFNIILLEGDGSTIIASNEPDNIEATDEEEHEALLAVLASDKPVVFIDRDDTDPDEDLEEDGGLPSEPATMSNDLPPYRLKPRFVSLTAPIHIEGETVGAINVKIILVSMEEHLRQLLITYLIAAVLGSLGVVLIVHFLMRRYVLNPVRRLRAGTREVTSGELSSRVSVSRQDEIGQLTTDFNTMAAALEQDAEEIAALEQLRDDLTSMIVHDMKTHLTVINLFSGLLQAPQADPLSPKQIGQVSQIRQASDTLENMVINLLNIRKLESGQMELNPAPSVNALLKNCEQTIRVKIDDDLPAIQADPDLLHRVLVNLLTNAIKFSEQGCETTVEAKLVDEHLDLRVNDEGEGIALEDQERIFEKFTQASVRKGGSRSDTGLGLAFCRLAVEAHEGTISVISPILNGRGSSFIVKIPIS